VQIFLHKVYCAATIYRADIADYCLMP